ncbi:hypothetical protein PVAP13_3KG503500 [Panicum virgatum]|uniref:chorismate mutase n=1 Tax=Panicum virgatum TaxID=38727 RepID=A0A8T0VA99_PANVG|nr:hypothetical protein PVAP13_3KG503500 [Panicum virgatum]
MTQDNRIFYSLLERSELPMNLETYSKESCEVPGFNGSLMDFIMQETEKAHARAGRYKRHGELLFFSQVVLEPVLPRF